MMTLDNVLIKFKTNMADQRMDMFVHSPAPAPKRQGSVRSGMHRLTITSNQVMYVFSRAFVWTVKNNVKTLVWMQSK